jgi:parallel beta-helix repeat protein
MGCGDDKTTNGDDPIDITVSISPERAVLNLNTTQLFAALVLGTPNTDVSWQVENIAGGNTEFGTISASGLYTAPAAEPDIDSVKVSAISVEDPSKSGIAFVTLEDPTKVYVSTSGSDTEGIGSRINPYRTITFAVSQADINQTIIVGAGEYNLAGGETFPILAGTGARIKGAGSDSTFVIGPGGSHDESGATFSVNGDAITIEKLNISTADSDGIGVWLLPGIQAKLKDNHIGSNYIGIYALGSNLPYAFIESNIITGDSIGIVTAESAAPMIRDNQITNCGIYGVHILESSNPDLGGKQEPSDAGGNIIQNCGQYLIYNDSPDTIWAVGNTWDIDDPIEDNDPLIYDDEESSGASGPVILENQ